MFQRFFSIFITSILLGACGPLESTLSPGEADDSIIGGSELTAQDYSSRYVVMVYDETLKKICTGTLIGPNLVLTAAHCVSQKPTGMTIAFGLNPVAGKYIRRRSEAYKVHPKSDLAMIRFTGTAPAGYEPISIPEPHFPLKEKLLFSAVGYGRINSPVSSSAKDAGGTGRARATELSIFGMSLDGTGFVVSQNTGKGICNGDSGGPAMMHYQGQNYIVGVASKVIWTVRKGKTPPGICLDRAVYVNVTKFTNWIEQTSQDLLQ